MPTVGAMEGTSEGESDPPSWSWRLLGVAVSAAVVASYGHTLAWAITKWPGKMFVGICNTPYCVLVSNHACNV